MLLLLLLLLRINELSRRITSSTSAYAVRLSSNSSSDSSSSASSSSSEPSKSSSPVPYVMTLISSDIVECCTDFFDDTGWSVFRMVRVVIVKAFKCCAIRSSDISNASFVSSAFSSWICMLLLSPRNFIIILVRSVSLYLPDAVV